MIHRFGQVVFSSNPIEYRSISIHLLLLDDSPWSEDKNRCIVINPADVSQFVSQSTLV